MVELKPCPWCGIVPDIMPIPTDSIEAFKFVCPENSTCRGSKLVIVFFSLKEDAIKGWKISK